MSKFKAVIFDLGGVILPQPQKNIALYGKKLGLPDRFFPELFLSNAPNNAFVRLERGELTISEFYSVFDGEAKAKSKEESIPLPAAFSSKDLFASFSRSPDTKLPINFGMLSATTTLRNSGFLTCLLTNNWIEDESERRKVTSKFMMGLKQYFNVVVESAHLGCRKPDTAIYKHTCAQLGVDPVQCIILDDIGRNLKAAKALGITTILVTDPTKALKELENLTEVKLEDKKSGPVFPASCNPAKLVHGYVQTREDIKIHFVESGSGPSVIFLHGFPDFWYCWRYQIPALTAAGYRAIALDQRGFGESSSPAAIEEYRQEELSRDVITLMDRLGIETATIVGHDWGGSLAWSLALKYPDRFDGVCGVNTPFFRINPKQNPMVSMKKNPGVFDYQLYFQTPGIAEKEFESDIRRSMKLFFQGYSETRTLSNDVKFSPSNARERGGLFSGMPNIPRAKFLTAADLDFYEKAFQKTGFRGPLNWYRTYELNWEWLRPIAHRKVSIPALMVTASHDKVLQPSFTIGMEKYVYNLTRHHIEKCGHWTPQEKPNELNEGLIKWLDRIHSSSVASKL